MIDGCFIKELQAENKALIPLLIQGESVLDTMTVMPMRSWWKYGQARTYLERMKDNVRVYTTPENVPHVHYMCDIYVVVLVYYTHNSYTIMHV